jgi:hypothetical protein
VVCSKDYDIDEFSTELTTGDPSGYLTWNGEYLCNSEYTFSYTEADVACREMGFEGASTYLTTTCPS